MGRRARARRLRLGLRERRRPDRSNPCSRGDLDCDGRHDARLRAPARVDRRALLPRPRPGSKRHRRRQIRAPLRLTSERGRRGRLRADRGRGRGRLALRCRRRLFGGRGRRGRDVLPRRPADHRGRRRRFPDGLPGLVHRAGSAHPREGGCPANRPILASSSSTRQSSPRCTPENRTPIEGSRTCRTRPTASTPRAAESRSSPSPSTAKHRAAR